MALSEADVAAIRAAEKGLAAAFESDDRTAWVSSYTEDAIFCGPGGVTLSGRAELLAIADDFAMSALQIAAESTIGEGDFAATMGRASWVTGPRGSDAPTVRRRFLMVWRRDADGRWRIAREQLTEDV
jgi:uncharacterized protein (TIGR02246 family)